MFLRSFILRVSAIRPLERFVRRSRLTRRVVRRFIAGETLEEAMRVAEDLVKHGFRVSLDFLGENTTKTEEADAACDEYRRIIEAIADSPVAGGAEPENVNVSVKLTQLGLDFEEDECFARLVGLLDGASRSGNFVRIDMEDSSCTQRTLGAATRAFETRKNVGVVLQSMLYRTDRDIEAINGLGMRVRLVKGAYLEKPNIARQKKADVDTAYLSMAKLLLNDGRFPAFGTHDHKIIKSIIAYSREKNISADKFEFQLLYGIRRELQKSLNDGGFGVRVYVPYGSSWYQYFSRRLAERPANLLFFLKNLFSR